VYIKRKPIKGLEHGPTTSAIKNTRKCSDVMRSELSLKTPLNKYT
jgi:hypothetical protein